MKLPVRYCGTVVGWPMERQKRDKRRPAFARCLFNKMKDKRNGHYGPNIGE